jgi:hypothetical protein
MKNGNDKKSFNSNTSDSLDQNIRDFEVFKSRVANALLDYMEAQSDLDLCECLEKSSMFLNNISVQMVKVFDNKNPALTDENEMSEIGDDLFSSSQQTLSNTIH